MTMPGLHVRLPKRLRAAMEAYATRHNLTLSQAVRLILSRATMPPMPYGVPVLPHWRTEAWTALLNALFGEKHLVLADEIRPLLEEAVAALDERQGQVLRLRFGLSGPRHTLEDVTAVMGVTRERVRQVEAKALRHLRYRLHNSEIWELIKAQLNKENA